MKRQVPALMYPTPVAVMMRETDETPARRHGHGHPVCILSHQRVKKRLERFAGIG